MFYVSPKHKYRELRFLDLSMLHVWLVIWSVYVNLNIAILSAFF